MSEAIFVSGIVAPMLAAIAIAYVLLRRQQKQMTEMLNKQQRENHDMLNSRMTQLVEEAKEAAFAAGREAGLVGAEAASLKVVALIEAAIAKAAAR